MKDSLKLDTNMVQYAVWPNCSNACEFCLRSTFGQVFEKKQQLTMLKKIRQNIDYIDWKEKFSGGISLLGGELYNIKDKELQDEFIFLVENII